MSRDLLTSHRLKHAARVNPDGLRRLARFMKLHIDGMSNRQVASLIRWRVTRDDMKYEL